MARYVAAGTSGGTPSATRPFWSVYSIAAVGFGLVEAAIFNTATTAHRTQLARLTTAGTPGSGATEAKYEPDSVAASCTAFNTHTADPSIGDKMHVMPCGAAIGAGTMLTFYDRPVKCAVGTANGLGIIVVSGTPQVSDVHMVWDE